MRHGCLAACLLQTGLSALSWLRSMQVTCMAEAVKVTADAETYCSPLYRPPELYNCPHSSQLDGRIDVWALGCVLFYMIAGVNPFEKQCQAGASLVLAVHKAHVPWEGLAVQPDLQELINSCLRPNFADRPTAQEVRAWIAEHEDRVGSCTLGSPRAGPVHGSLSKAS